MSASNRVVKTLSILLVCVLVSRAEYEDKDKPVTYHGIIREDGREGDQVVLDKALYVRTKDKLMGDEVCGYTLYKSSSELPFKVVLLDHKDGEAKIVLAAGYSLNYERQHLYTFDVAAHDCSTGTHSGREKVVVEVQDVNEFAPQWKDEMYIAEVEEGRIFDQIVQLRAEDEDGSSDQSRICHYHIITPDVPFRVDTHGYLQNTDPLDYSRQHNYILEVKAEDCGGKLSEQILVNIAVKESCKTGWNHIPEETSFTPGSGSVLIGEDGELNFCEGACPESTISASVSLSSQQAGEECDKDTYSLQAQRRMCGANPETVDLLPNPTLGSWTKTPEKNQNSDQTFSFDGVSNAIEVLDSKVDGRLGSSFSIATWMKHLGTEEDRRHEGKKEHVLCYSDGEYHNRHHYSVFVHNCHLVLLLRQEPGDDVDLNQFKPAEWRWDIPQTCDGEWHHYTVNVDFPEVHMFVDGHLTIESDDSPIIVDDWPLHPSKKILSRKLVVGACWHGGDRQMAQHFLGQLAGLTLLRAESEEKDIINCLSDCQEKIDFHDMADLETGMYVSMNSAMSQITFNGHNKSFIERLIQHVGYKNARVYPTPGPRTLTLTTHVQCGESAVLEVPDLSVVVNVAQPEKPIMRLVGSDRVSYDEDVISRGVSVLADLSITSNVKKSNKDSENAIQSTLEDPDTLRYQLDSCVIRADPGLNLNNEHLTYPRKMVKSLGMEVSANDEGLILAGANTVKHYQDVLRAIHYLHSSPSTFNTRHFVVSCTELNGRFVSNDYEVQLDVIHKDHIPLNPPVAHHQDSVVYQQLNDVRIKEAPLHAKSSGGLAAGTTAGTGTGVGMVVMIVVCVGFLLFMIVLGVIRIRSAQQRREVAVEDKPEMEWDNSALTITVNPMDRDTAYDEEAAGVRGDADSDSDDDVSVSHDELDTSEDEAVKEPGVKDRDLEWDDSTLTF